MRLVPVGGRLIEVQVRESARARRARIVVAPGRPPEVVVPLRTSERTIRALLDQHEGWLARQLARAPEPRLTLEPMSEHEGRNRARALVHKLVGNEAPRLGVSVGRIAIRDQRTRWGSCSSRGTLSFNWRLVLAPPEVAGYVVVHELCHLWEPNHSPRFWRLVADARPGYPEQRRWLAEHGWELHAYKPS
ncbi:MAG TPA: M48 family metallopeptidase [Gaiellaceae bacterium]